jgi:hypothetical protein
MLKIAAAIAAAVTGCVSLAAVGVGADRPQFHVPHRALKGDRLPIGPACSQAARPNYESKCIRDTRPPSGQPSDVRVVRITSTDGLVGGHPVISFAN